MALASGTRLGPYEIANLIGSGGMGEVYKARDTRLDRTVAIKVASDNFSERFDREARAIAALNHQNICQLYDVGPNYLVMEYVDGVPLAGPLPIDEAQRVAIQICDALEAAHRSGIVHRDLKPANILLTRKGGPSGPSNVKLLDFGLAKLDQAVTPNTESMTRALTGAGTILGTLQYMSPEQLQGREADARSDIFSFGLVLYEMITGKRAYDGTNPASVIAAILERPAPTLKPEGMNRVVQTCLVKNPDDRFQTARDLKRAIEWSMTPVVGPVSASRPRRRWIAWATVAVALTLSAFSWLRPPPDSRSALADLTLSITSPTAIGIVPVGSSGARPSIAPDASAVLYLGANGQPQLRHLNSVVADALPTAFGGNFAFWSPDARALAADTTTGLQRLRLPDGTPELITTLKGPVLGGTWSETGALLFAQVTSAVELYTVPAGGGSAAKIELPGVGEGGYFWPEFLPGGNDFLVSFQPRGAPLPDVYLATLRDGKAENPVRLMTNPTAASFTPAAGGRLLFVRSDTLYSQSLNLTRRSLEGDPEVVVRGVASSPIFRAASFSVSRTGVVAWRPGREAISQLTTFDRQGKSLGTTGPAGLLLSVKLSPDERHVLVSSGTDVWMAEIDQPGRQILSQDAFPTTWAWSSKTSQFLVPRGLRLFERPLSAIEDKSAEHEIGRAEGLVRIEDVSSDGRSVLFTPGPNSTALFSLSLDTHMSSPVLQSGEYVFNARFSPDGKWIVFEAYPAGDLATRPGGIYVQPFPKGPRRQVSGTGQYPVWRRDGKEIVFHDFMRGGIASIAVQPIGADLKFGNSETLFTVRWPSESVSDVTPMAVSRDGARIYLPQPMDQPDSNVIHVRTGWTSH